MWTYSIPSLGTANAITQSTLYSVNVAQGSTNKTSQSLQLTAPSGEAHTTGYNTISWTTFSADDAVTVTVQKLSGTVTSCAVYPASYGITPVVNATAKTATFTLYPNQKVAVIFDNDWTTHPLMVFADVPEQNIPTGSGPNVIYYGPGVYSAGSIAVSSGQTVYLAGGAYVKGYINPSTVNNVTIRGRGILSGEDGAYHTFKTILTTSTSTNTTVEGISLVRGNWFNCATFGTGNVIRNIKILGQWTATKDGINTGDNGLVENCFVSTTDDHVKLYNDGATVRNCVFWPVDNGAVFQHGWGAETGTNNTVQQIDVIRTDWGGINYNRAIFDNADKTTGAAGTNTFDNVRADTGGYGVFQFRKVSTGTGTLSNLTMKNVVLSGWTNTYSRVISSAFTNINFQNLYVNGSIITSGTDVGLVLQSGGIAPGFSTINSGHVPPAIAFSLPISGGVYPVGSSVVATVSSKGQLGASVTGVKLYKNNVLVRNEGTAPYRWNDTGQDAALQNLTAGTYTLRADSTDSNGLVSTASITITVQ